MATILRRYPTLDFAYLRWAFAEWWENFEPSPMQRRVVATAVFLLLGAITGAAVGLLDVTGAIAAISIIAVVFIIRDFRAGVGMLVLMLPISQSNVFPHEMFGITGVNPLNLLVMTTLFSLYMRWLGHGMLKGFMPRSLFWLYVAPLIMGSCLGMFHWEEIPSIFRDLDMLSVSSTGTYWRDMFFKPFMFVIYALLVACAVQKTEKPERLITPMIVSIVIMAMLAIGFVAIEGYSLSQLAGTYMRQTMSQLGMHANDLGRLYATAYAPLLFMWGRTNNGGLKLLLVIVMAMVAGALLLTFSRGAFLGFIIVNIIFLISRRSAKLIACAVILVPLALAMAPGAFWDRVTMGVGQGADAVTAGRTGEIWEPLFPEFMDSPIYGKGTGAVMWSRAMREGRIPLVSHPHNAYFQAYLDMGLIGLFSLTGFWIYIWARCLRYGKDPRLPEKLQGFFQGSAAGIAAFLVAGFAGSSLEPDPAQVFMWLAVGMMYGLAKRLAIKIS